MQLSIVKKEKEYALHKHHKKAYASFGENAIAALFFSPQKRKSPRKEGEKEKKERGKQVDIENRIKGYE